MNTYKKRRFESQTERRTSGLGLLKVVTVYSMLAFLMVPIFFIAKGTFSAVGQSTQTEDRLLKKVSFKNEPIEFTSVWSDGQSVRFDEKFRRHNDWLEDLTIEFKNVSEKPIVYLSIAILFPETNTTEPPVVHFLRYGINPLAKLPSNKKLPSSTDALREKLQPNESAKISVAPESFAQMKSALAGRRPLAELTQAEFQIMVVFFEDGSQWSAGTYARPDPDRPGKFIPFKHPSGRDHE